MIAVATKFGPLTLGSHRTPETSVSAAYGVHGDIRFDDKGRPRSKTLHRIGDTSEEFLKTHAVSKVRIRTDDAEISIGYLLFNDLAGARVGHHLGYRRPGYGQQKRQTWVIDQIKPADIREITYLD